MCAAAAGLAALPIVPQLRQYAYPVPQPRPGCPCIHTLAQEVTTPRGSIQKIAAMTLTSGDHRLDLSHIHRKLEEASLPLQKTGSSNVLLTSVSFNCEISTDPTQPPLRDFITFDLKIPGAGINDGVFSSDMEVRSYGKSAFFQNIEFFFHRGRQIANPQNHKHGVIPNYRKADVTHDQYILHTEQSLVSYLARPQTASMLTNYLRTAIRGKYPDAIATKIHNLGLHMHSTKTCCGPCEYSLIGLMNSPDVGLIPNLREACANQNEVLVFQVDPHFKMVTTVTANESDQTHKAKPLDQRFVRALNNPVTQFIDLTSIQTPKQIFTTLLTPYSPARAPALPSEFEGTIGISGSLKTPGSPATAQRHRERTNEDLDNLTNGVKELLI